MKKRCLNCGSVYINLLDNGIECLSCGEFQKNEDKSIPISSIYTGEEIYKLNINKVVSILSKCEECEKYGTGIIVNGYVITNAHVINKNLDCNDFSLCDEIFAINTSNNITLCDFVYCDLKLDLAILKLEENLGNGFDLINGVNLNFDIGEKVVTIGNALGNGLMLTEGNVSSVAKRKGINTLVMTNSITNGNSGGPVINFKNQIVGVVFAREKKEVFKYAIAIKYVIDFIKKAEQMENLKIL